MADKKVSDLNNITNLSGDDLLLVVNDPSGTPSSRKVTVANMFANVVPDTVHKGLTTLRANTSIFGSKLTITANTTFSGNLRVTPETPSTNNAAIEGHKQGSIWFDADYLYIATTDAQIKRVPLNVF